MKSFFLESLFYESIKVLFLISSPILLSILFVGFFVSIFQAMTSINEQTLSFIPKIIVVFLIFMFFGGWMFDVIIHYMEYIFNHISSSILLDVQNV